MDVTTIREAVGQLHYGKKLPAAVYVWDVDGASLPPVLRIVCGEIRKRQALSAEFNLIKFHTDRPKISFLSYPSFFSVPHPELVEAVVVDLATGAVRRDSYSGRANPPILHRKETFLPAGHPTISRFRILTLEEEKAGLLADTSRIGFRMNWERLLAQKGLCFRGHRLVRMNMDGDSLPTVLPRRGDKVTIQRHKTAISRVEPSKPLKLILEHRLIQRRHTFFDYGCGLGADIEAMRQLGYSADGWDPVHARDCPKIPADVVNLGFVLNVIEDPAERVEVLVNAWSLTRELLVVSTLVRGQESYTEFRCWGDGLLTSRNTFQKFFDPAELQALIEDSLQEEAIPVSLGIYVVFRNVAAAQDFLSQRARRHIDWISLSHRLGLKQALRRKRDPYDTHQALLDDFWNTVIELGRIPREDEFDRINEVRSACGSVPQAMNLFNVRFGEATLAAARARKGEDTLVYVAAAKLRKRRPFNSLSPLLQRNIRSFFGSYTEAERLAMEAMFAAGDVDELSMAVQSLGFGWWNPAEEQFTIHRSLLDELPSVLRIFVECAARLFGNPREADLIKFHLRSRKITFQHYDDFDGAPFPELRLRIKIDLPRMFVTVLDQSHVDARQLLYFKERFVAEDYPNRKRMEQISRRLEKLGFDAAKIGYGPSMEDFQNLLRRSNLTWALTSKPRSKDLGA